MTAHQAEQQPGDLFALASTCVHCGRRLLWRIGTGVWEHADDQTTRAS
jgi:ribosomal protein L37AE/L43A